MRNPINEQVLKLCDVTGVDEATLKMAICLFGTFPFNVVLKRLPDRNVSLKCYYIIAISGLFLYGLDLGDGFKTLMISSTFTYLFTRYSHSKLMPWINFVFVMGHLCFSHLHAQFFNDYDNAKLDITGAQMVLVMKLTAFAWSVYDGRQTELTPHQASKAIKQHPSPLHFFSYVFFYPSLLTGPSFDFADYESWLNTEVFRDLPESKRPGRNRKRAIPKSGRVALWKVIKAIGWLALSFKAPEYVNLDYVLKGSFASRNFFFKIVYFYLLAFTFRFRYYAAWTISEASCIVCGLGYNGYHNGKIMWNRVQNIDIWGFESSQNTHAALEAWNQNTNKWLKYYVYTRVVKKGQKPGFRSTLFTFVTSAFWHGTRPGYYLSFATGALFQTCGKHYRRNLRPLFLNEDGSPKKSKVFYDITCYVVTQLAFGYLVQPFVILDLGSSLKAWGMTYFYVHIGIAITFVLFNNKAFLKWLNPRQAKAKAEAKVSKKIDAPMHLGIPDAELNLDEALKDMKALRAEVEEWAKANGVELEEDELVAAYNAFKKELLQQVAEKTHKE